LQTLPSLHDVPLRTGVLAQPVAGAQVSVVQMLPSLQLSGAAAVHTPLWQVSSPSQASPSAQEDPFGTAVVRHPVAGSQLSVVQTLPSLQVSGVPAVQAPLWQVSLPLHTLPSAQAVPFRTGVLEQPKIASQVSVVHGFASLQLRIGPAVHDPA
jgi:hypothetical protein